MARRPRFRPALYGEGRSIDVPSDVRPYNNCMRVLPPPRRTHLRLDDAQAAQDSGNFKLPLSNVSILAHPSPIYARHAAVSIVQITSATDPQVHTESGTFSLRYPSTLLSFRITGVPPSNLVGRDASVKKQSLLLLLVVGMVLLSLLSPLSFLPLLSLFLRC